jgi:plasmid replication initiation protein
MTCEPELMEYVVQSKPNVFVGRFDHIKKKRANLKSPIEYLPVEAKTSADNKEKPHIVEIRLLDSTYKNDLASMEAPIFSLSTNVDTKIWNWESINGEKKLQVIPSAYGRATIFDKDIIIYVISCLVARKNLGLPLAKLVRFKIYDYFQYKYKGGAVLGKSDYLRFEHGLKRLKGTTIETNIKTDNMEILGLFSLIEKALLVKVNGKLECVEITLSDWIFNSIDCLEVATIHPDFFKLRRPLERRLYEIARKHCNVKASWKMGIDPLINKIGSRSSLVEFKRMLREIIKLDRLPDYRLKIDGIFVVFYQKDTKKLAAALGV